MDAGEITMALPLTVYAVNAKYTVRDGYEDVVGPDAVVVFVLHQFGRAGVDPIGDDDILAEVREVVESDTFAPDYPVPVLRGKRIGEVYEFGGNWSAMKHLVKPTPCQGCLRRASGAQVGQG